MPRLCRHTTHHNMLAGFDPKVLTILFAVRLRCDLAKQQHGGCGDQYGSHRIEQPVQEDGQGLVAAQRSGAQQGRHSVMSMTQVACEL